MNKNCVHVRLLVLLVILVAFLLFGLGALIIQASQVFKQTGHFPSSLLCVLVFYAITISGLIVLGCLAPKLQEKVTRMWERLCESGVIIFLIANFLAFVVLIGQIENWLLAGVHFLTLSLIGALLLLGIPAVYIFLRCLIQGHRGKVKCILQSHVEKLSATSAIAIIVVLATASLSCYRALHTPLSCDEAGTVILFSKSLEAALTHYDSPNNHILNSVLTFLVVTLLRADDKCCRLMAN